MNELCSLVIAGHSHSEIQRQLGLPEKKLYYRYLSEAFEHDRELISQRITNEEILNQDDIVIERVNLMDKQMDELAAYKGIEAANRTAAQKRASLC